MHSLFSEFDKNMLQVQLELVASIAWAAQSVQCVHIPCTKTEEMDDGVFLKLELFC